MVDPLEEGVVDNRSLSKRLREAPQKIAGYISEATRNCVAHVLGFVKSFRPNFRMEIPAEEIAADCTEDKFREYLDEVRPTAKNIVESLEQD